MYLHTENKILSKKQHFISQKIKKNLEKLRTSLVSHQNDVVSAQSQSQSQKNQKQTMFIDRYSPFIKEFLINIQNPYKSLLMMPRLLNKTFSLTDPDPIFTGSQFHQSLQSSLTAYLHTQTPYIQMKQSSNRIIDVFYKYLLYEENTLMEISLQGSSNQQSSLGNWLKQQGINKMFKKYYDQPSSYTIFLSNFMIYGIAYIFISATKILKNDIRVIKNKDISLDVLQNIEVAYVRKYRLDCLIDSNSPFLF